MSAATRANAVATAAACRTLPGVSIRAWISKGASRPTAASAPASKRSAKCSPATSAFGRTTLCTSAPAQAIRSSWHQTRAWSIDAHAQRAGPPSGGCRSLDRPGARRGLLPRRHGVLEVDHDLVHLEPGSLVQSAWRNRARPGSSASTASCRFDALAGQCHQLVGGATLHAGPALGVTGGHLSPIDHLPAVEADVVSEQGLDR